MHLFVVHPMIFCPRHLSFGQTNVSAVSISYPLRVLPLELKRESFSCFLVLTLLLFAVFHKQR